MEPVLNIEKSILKAMSFTLCLSPQTIGHIRPDSFISLYQEMDRISFSLFAFFMAKHWKSLLELLLFSGFRWIYLWNLLNGDGLSTVSHKFCPWFWQFNRASVGPKWINHWENPNIETQNPKQYQNPNALNSKQKRTCTIVFRFNHWYFCH